MRWHALLFILLVNRAQAASFVFPTNMSESDIPKIVQSFNSGFVAREPLTLVGQDKFKTEVTARLNTIDTKTVSKLGDRSSERDVQVTEIGFAKKIPFNVELGLYLNSTLFNRDVRSFGGYTRWGFQQNPWGDFSFLVHGSSASYKNLIGTNIYGILLGFDTQVWVLHVEAGVGALRMTNNFDASLFQNSGSDQSDVTYGKTFSHQFIKAVYVWDNIAVGGQVDWIRSPFTSVDVTYLF
jgi:hypothetical protein